MPSGPVTLDGEVAAGRVGVLSVHAIERTIAPTARRRRASFIWTSNGKEIGSAAQRSEANAGRHRAMLHSIHEKSPPLVAGQHSGAAGTVAQPSRSGSLETALRGERERDRDAGLIGAGEVEGDNPRLGVAYPAEYLTPPLMKRPPQRVACERWCE